MTSLRRVFRAACSVTAASLIVKLVALAKEFAIAGSFARSDALDAFLIAFLVPNLLVNLLSETMGQALIPALERERAECGQQAADRLLSDATWALAILLVSASLLTAILAPWTLPLIAHGFNATKLTLTLHLLWALLPMVVLTGLAVHLAAALNTAGRFLLPALAPVTVPLLTLIAATSPHSTIWTLVTASILGAALHLTLVQYLLHRHGIHLHRPRWHITATARATASQYTPILLSAVIANLGLVVDQACAASLAPGSVATLSYAARFVSVALALIASSVSTALAPHFGQLVAQADWAGCRKTFHQATWAVAAITTPIALALIFGSNTIVRLAYQHGSFHASDTTAVAPAAAMFAIGIPFFAASRVGYRFLLAINRSDLILQCGLFNLGLDIALDLILMRFWGVAGLALATSLWMVATFAFLAYWSLRLLPITKGKLSPNQTELSKA